MSNKIWILIFLHSFSYYLVSAEPNIAFLILSQDNIYNYEMACKLEKHIIMQYKNLNLKLPEIFITPRNFSDVKADWTITPLIVPLLELVDTKAEYIFMSEDYTNVSVHLLNKGLEKYHFAQENWIGYSLFDSDATVIHHFAFHKNPTFFKYPLTGSGMVFSLPFLKRLKTRIVQNELGKLDFHIDAAHEFALFVYDNGKGPMIQHDDMFCVKEGSECAAYPKSNERCGKFDPSLVNFAVKTCEKYHNDRVETVKKTWGQYASKIYFFSDYEDPEIPSVFLGVPNTEQGHCGKTMAILKYMRGIFNDNPQFLWLSLVDDDTILSVSRISVLTTCHETTDRPLILGERYRFGRNGFDYPTGGAGILFNRLALNKLADECSCPRVDAPDDMVLGTCSDRLGISLVHVPQMHQARPADYPPGRLANNDAISFHKHWMLDPVETYRQWFEQDDYKLEAAPLEKTEL